MNLAVHTVSEPHDECPHCGIFKPLHFFLCRAYFRDLPWLLFRDLKSAEHVAIYHARKDARRWLSAAEANARFEAAKAAALSHLKQFSTATP